jgi:ABC-type glycerol-3-phosphate transport system substrate-binding protein
MSPGVPSAGGIVRPAGPAGKDVERRATRRRHVFGAVGGLAGTLVALTVAGCGAGGGGSGGDAIPAASAAPVKLRLWTWWGPGVLAGAEEWNKWQMAEFSRRYPNVTMETEFVTSGIADKFLVAAAANDTPEVSHASVAWARDSFDKGAVLALDSFVAKTPDAALAQFLPVATLANRARGRTFGLPGEGPALASLPFNKNQFQEVGLPVDAAALQKWTWNDFAAAATKLTKRDGDTVTRGATSLGLSLQNFVTLLYTNGVPSLYEQEGRRIHSLVKTRGVEVVQFFYDLVAGKYRVHLAPAAGENTRTQFFGGKIAILPSDSDAHASLNAQKPADLQWDAMLWPKGPGGDKLRTLGWSNMHLVPAASKQPEYGFRFAAFNSSLDAGVKRLELVGATGARRAFYEHAAWKRFVAQQPQQATVYNTVKFQDQAGGYPYVRQAALSGVLNPLVQDVLAGRRSAKEAIDEFVSQAEQTVLADVPA